MSVLLATLHDVLLDGRSQAEIGIALVQPMTEVEVDGETVYEPAEVEVSYNWLHWESESHPKPTEEEFNAAVVRARSLSYQEQRRVAYPSVEQQLDTLYHEGFDGWRATVEAVKKQFPKPEV